MIDLNAIERVGITNRIYQIQQRIANIEEQFQVDKMTVDFQSRLDKEIEKQDKLEAEKKAAANKNNLAQNNAEVKTNPLQDNFNQNNLPVSESEIINAAKVIVALASGNAATPNVVTPTDKNYNLNRYDSNSKNDRNVEKSSSTNTSYRRTSSSSGSSTEDLINTSAQKNGVDPLLARAVAIVESNMNQDGISPAGAIGVMQLMPETAAYLGVDPYDEEQNIEGGVRFLRQMLDKFEGNVPNALAAYNAGPGAVQRYGGVPPYKETQNYVGRILDIVGG